jgi:hypothetical protein
LIVPEQIIIERNDGWKSNCIDCNSVPFFLSSLAVIGFEIVAAVSNFDGNFTLS